MADYRCYFHDQYSLRAAPDLEAPSDEDAVRVAESTIRSKGGRLDWFEVWQRDRLVDVCCSRPS